MARVSGIVISLIAPHEEVAGYANSIELALLN